MTELTNEDGEVKADAGQLFSQLVTNKFKEVERDRAENSYKRGIKEKAESIEAALKPLFKKHGITAEKLEDAAAELGDKLKNISGEPGKSGKAEELTADQIKKLPAYQSLLDEELSKVQAKAQEWESKYNDYVTQSERQKVFSVVRDHAISLLDSKNAVWGPDKLRQMEYFFKATGTDQYRLNEQGKPEIVDKEGQPLRDDARNRVDFDTFILNEWKAAGYQFHEAPPGSGTAGAKPGGAAGGGLIVVNSPEHYERLLKDAGADMAKKVEVRQAYAEYLKTQAQQ